MFRRRNNNKCWSLHELLSETLGKRKRQPITASQINVSASNGPITIFGNHGVCVQFPWDSYSITLPLGRSTYDGSITATWDGILVNGQAAVFAVWGASGPLAHGGWYGLLALTCLY